MHLYWYHLFSATVSFKRRWQQFGIWLKACAAISLHIIEVVERKGGHNAASWRMYMMTSLYICPGRYRWRARRIFKFPAWILKFTSIPFGPKVLGGLRDARWCIYHRGYCWRTPGPLWHAWSAIRIWRNQSWATSKKAHTSPRWLWFCKWQELNQMGLIEGSYWYVKIDDYYGRSYTCFLQMTMENDWWISHQVVGAVLEVFIIVPFF